MSDNDFGAATIAPPWTETEVEVLNGWQRSGVVHPFTCRHRGEDGHGVDDVLVAGPDGWHCPSCDYTQTWAHRYMTDHELLGRMSTRLLGPLLGRDLIDALGDIATIEEQIAEGEEEQERRKFFEYYATETGVTVAWLIEHGYTCEPCACDSDLCTGWQMIRGDRLPAETDPGE